MSVLHRTFLKRNVAGKNPAKVVKKILFLFCLCISIIFSYIVYIILLTTQFSFKITPNILQLSGNQNIEISSFFIQKKKFTIDFGGLVNGRYAAKISIVNTVPVLDYISLIQNDTQLFITLHQGGGNEFTVLQNVLICVFLGISFLIFLNGISAFWIEQNIIYQNLRCYEE